MKYVFYACILGLTGCLDAKEEEKKEGEQQGDCRDGEDNDNDGKIDCEDAGCSDKPACEDIEEDTAWEPASEPSSSPTSEPASQPSNEPASQPSNEPASQPSNEPASQPTSEPDSEPLPSYTGGYNPNPCSAQTTGYGVGQVAGDFALMDQYGDTVYLSDFCGNAVLLVSAAFW